MSLVDLFSQCLFPTLLQCYLDLFPGGPRGPLNPENKHLSLALLHSVWIVSSLCHQVYHVASSDTPLACTSLRPHQSPPEDRDEDIAYSRSVIEMQGCPHHNNSKNAELLSMLEAYCISLTATRWFIPTLQLPVKMSQALSAGLKDQD